MIDFKFGVHRCIAEYSEETEEQLATYYLGNFDLAAFQKQFGVFDSTNPMFDCYEILEEDVTFLEPYITDRLHWDFIKNSYFVEAYSA